LWIENGMAANVETELFQVGETCPLEFAGEFVERHAQWFLELMLPTPQKLRPRLSIGLRHRELQLETSPDSPIEEFWMVGCRHDNDVTGEPVDLEKERTDNALHFTRFMDVPALLGYGIELVEEQDTLAGANVLEQPLNAPRGFSQEAADQTLVADDEEGEHQQMGQRLSQGSLAVSGRPGEQDAMARLDAMRLQEVPAVLLFRQVSERCR
jgi:hypothetical protein